VAGQMTATWRTNVVAEHNKARTTLADPPAINMMTLVYNMSLEAVAQKYLDTNYPKGCNNNYVPNPNRGEVGENWYSGQPAFTDSDLGATAAWTTWALRQNEGRSCSERDNFYSLNGCLQVSSFNWDGTFNASWNTGNFTQVMWATTAQIGCGYKSGCGTVCNYYPPGNWNMPNGLLKPTDIWKGNSQKLERQPKQLLHAITHAPTTTHTTPTTTTPPPTTTTTPPPTTTTTPPPTTTTLTTTTPPPTTTLPPGYACYAANDAIFAALTPTLDFLNIQPCSPTLSTACTVCGPSGLTVSQTGSTYVTIDLSISCTYHTPILFAYPAFLNVSVWSIEGDVPVWNDDTEDISTVEYQMMTNAPGAVGLVRAEWCAGGFYAAFPVSVVHQ